MVREWDIATELMYVAIYPDGGQCCFWHGALMLGARSVAHSNCLLQGIYELISSKVNQYRNCNARKNLGLTVKVSDARSNLRKNLLVTFFAEKHPKYLSLKTGGNLLCRRL